MARVIYTDDEGTSMAALYGRQTLESQNYMGQAFNNYLEKIGNAGSDIIAGVKNRFADIRSNTAVQHIENLRNRLNSTWELDTIRYLDSIPAIQQAPLSMRRYVMAHPDMIDRYGRGQIEAYDGTSKVVGECELSRYYTNRRVMHGVVQNHEDHVSYTNYYEPIIDDTDLLNSIQRSLIIRTWDIMDTAKHEGNNADPTSVWNGVM